MPLSIQNFREHHDQLLVLVDQVQELIDQPDISACAHAVRAALVTLSAHVCVHLATEDTLFYARLLGSNDPVVRSTAERFQVEMGGIERDVMRYADTWPAHAIRDNTNGFITATKVVLGQLRDRISLENSELFPLALAANRSISPLSGLEIVTTQGHDQRPLVCIVEDNLGDVILFREAWKEIRPDIAIEHFDLADAFLARHQTPPVPDLIILDLNLPRMNGDALLRILRSESFYQCVPVIICSTSYRSEDIAVAKAHGATAFFPKPETFEEYLPFVGKLNDLIDYNRSR
jgi:CheY-like chemotaxis protein